ncbi:MAG: hypothetical protein ABIC04_04130 [Nanoarchaeota archaeon]
MVWLLNGISMAFVAIVSFFCFFFWYRNKCTCKVGKAIFLNGILYLVYAFLTILWSMDVIEPVMSDFIFIDGIFNVFKAVLFLMIVYYMIHNKNLLYFLFLFLLTVLAIFSSLNTFFLIVSFASYAIIAIVSFDLFLLSNRYLKKTATYAITYSVICVCFLLSVFIWRDPSSVPWFIPNALMFIVFLLFFYDVRYCRIGKNAETEPKIKKIMFPFLFFKFVVFITSMTLFLLLSTISIHEMGHTLSAQYYGCEKSKAVIYDIADSAHTEMVCSLYYNDLIVTLAGVLLPLIVGLIFLLTGGSFTSNISYLIIGFSLILPSKDLETLHFSNSMIFLVIISGIVIVMLGVIRFTTYYISSHTGSESKPRGFRPEREFWVDNRESVGDLYEFVTAIHSMGNIKFKQCIQSRMNEVLNWINNDLEEKELSRLLQKKTGKTEMQIVIMNYLLKSEADSEKNILKYVCYPILKEKIREVNNANPGTNQNQS